jgi:hypothetical protein
MRTPRPCCWRVSGAVPDVRPGDERGIRRHRSGSAGCVACARLSAAERRSVVVSGSYAARSRLVIAGPYPSRPGSSRDPASSPLRPAVCWAGATGSGPGRPRRVHASEVHLGEPATGVYHAASPRSVDAPRCLEGVTRRLCRRWTRGAGRRDHCGGRIPRSCGTVRTAPGSRARPRLRLVSASARPSRGRAAAAPVAARRCRSSRSASWRVLTCSRQRLERWPHAH